MAATRFRAPAATRSADPAVASPAPCTPAGADEDRARHPGERVLEGPLRPGASTKLLVRRLARGEIALIDHLDIDRVSAEELIDAGAAAVLNCSPSSSGSYPNLGPQLLLEAGIPLIDLDGAGRLFARVHDGELVRVRVCGPGDGGLRGGRELRRGELLRGGELIASGEVFGVERVRAQACARRGEIDAALERFTRNTLEHMREERELLDGGLVMPRFATDMRERATLVLARGVGYRRDLLALEGFVRDERPVLLAVDGAADALLERGLVPHMIVGDMDSASERALSCGAELVVHAYADGRAPGSARLAELGLDFQLVHAPGLSEDLALLIAAEQGARLIVSVGSQFNLLDFLDRGRSGMSSSFLTRLRVGEILVDAKGVSLVSGSGRVRVPR